MSLPAISALPTPPSRSDDSDTFVSRADAFVAAQIQFVAEMNAAINALPAIVLATNYNTTSTTSLTIGTGSKSFTVETGKLFQIGQFVIAASASGVTNWMAGQVTSYNSVTGALVVNVLTVSGSGTKTDWVISPTVAGNIASLAAIATTGSGADLTAASVTYAKMQSTAAASVIIGRGAGAGGGVVTELALGANISMTGNTINVSTGTATLGVGDYGDVTVSSAGAVITIDAGAVTYSKIQNVSATDMLLGRSSAGAGVVQEIACTSPARTLIAQTTQALMRSTGLGLGSISTFAEATTAEIRANTAARAVSTDKAWASADFVTLTDAATIAVDFSAGFNFTLPSLGGNRTLGNPTNTKTQSGCIEFIQDTTGGRTLAFSSNWKFASGSAPILSTAANAKDYIFYQVRSATLILVTGIVKGVS